MSDTKYCYPNSNVLRNKKNLTDGHDLMEAETQYTAVRLLALQDMPIMGSFDFDHLKQIHGYLFQDLYEWAGEPRTVNIGKGNLFCLVQYIDSYADTVFGRFAKDCIAAKPDPERFVRTLAGHYADMNALHPFREGNGRAQREFARQLCLHCGYAFDLTQTSHVEMLRASRLSFDTGDNSALASIFKRVVRPIQNMEP